MKNPSRILIVRLDRIGDVVLSTPVIANLRAAFPDAHIAFMCRPVARDIVDGNLDLDEVIIYDKNGAQKNFFKTFLFACGLARKNFDWAVNLHPSNRSNWILFIAGIPVRAGWDRKNGRLLTHRIRDVKHEGLKHELEYNLDVLRALEVPIVSEKLYFPVKDHEMNQFRLIFEAMKINVPDKMIVIHASASCPSKRWPQEYFIELVGKISKWGKVVIVGEKNENCFSDKIAAESKIIDLRGKLTLAQLGCLFKKSLLFISNDSGPVHIAAAVGTPVISIFGRNDPGLSPARWRPLGENSRYLHKTPGCKPCLAHNCDKDFRCLRLTTPDDVYTIAKSILEPNGGQTRC